jgi:hypothetical protein
MDAEDGACGVGSISIAENELEKVVTVGSNQLLARLAVLYRRMARYHDPEIGRTLDNRPATSQKTACARSGNEAVFLFVHGQATGLEPATN